MIQSRKKKLRFLKNKGESMDSENFMLSRRVMRLLQERLQEDLWYSQERQDIFEEDC